VRVVLSPTTPPTVWQQAGTAAAAVRQPQHTMGGALSRPCNSRRQLAQHALNLLLKEALCWRMLLLLQDARHPRLYRLPTPAWGQQAASAPLSCGGQQVDGHQRV
jgi:hypothetical protein